jgi:hypothetical protein
MPESEPWLVLLVVLFAGYAVADSDRLVRELLIIIGWIVAGNILGVVIGMTYGFSSTGAVEAAELASFALGAAASIECMRRTRRLQPRHSGRARRQRRAERGVVISGPARVQ